MVPWVPWFLGSFIGTLVYLILVRVGDDDHGQTK